MTASSTDTDTARTYAWTPGRIAFAVLIVLAGAGSITVIGWKTLRDPHAGSGYRPITPPQFNLDNLQIARDFVARSTTYCLLWPPGLRILLVGVSWPT